MKTLWSALGLAVLLASVSLCEAQTTQRVPGAGRRANRAKIVALNTNELEALPVGLAQ
jgi:hypothetical protein